jgi:hypothetical protein
MPITYIEFKLNKEIAHEDTFQNDKKIRKQYDEYIKETKTMEEKMLNKPIYLNVYKNESDNPKAPTFKASNVEIKETIVIPAGTYDFTFWGNSINNKSGKPNPHLKIDNPWKPKSQNNDQGIDNQGGNDDTPF